MIRLLLLAATVLSQETLLLSQIIFRHSSRAPIATFTSEASKNYFYRGLGEISDDGLQLAQDLGKALRPRLIDNGFLDPRYIPSQSYFRSSASGRCIVTASAVGSALFNPVNASIPNQINVQTINSDDDWLCVPQTTSWLLEKMVKSVGAEYNSTITLETFAMDLFQNWTVNSTVFKHAFDPDGLVIEKEAGLPVPAWFDDAAAAEVLFYMNKYDSFYTGTGEYNNPQWIRCRSGLLLYTIMNNIKRKVACGSNCTTPKFYAYATHDFMIQSLLGGFGLVKEALQGGIPPFTGAILIELWQNGNNSYVKLFWKSPRTQFVLLTSKIGTCSGLENCPVDQFTRCCSEYSSAKPQTECNYLVSVAVQQVFYILLALLLIFHTQ